MAGRRERILTEGFRLFSENNIDKVPMYDVADAAGVGIATLYRYYLTKSELVLAISTDIWTKYVNVDYKKLENDIKADMTAAQVYEYMLDAFIDLYRNHCIMILSVPSGSCESPAGIRPRLQWHPPSDPRSRRDGCESRDCL